MKDQQHATAPQQGQFERLPYQKPAFQHEPVFETMALACGKVNITQQACRGRRNAS
ncbi:hypothetical protein [Thermomonas flagellata]|uniref:hypothetical protein n=1 Tax=Thermomonas flagellata TaxID=2888524 RepID=UPI001F04DB3D|nr:hypothetical protein [Thermomonas flagellata]